MAKYLIVNIAAPIWIGEDRNSHIWDYLKIKEEYCKEPYNADYAVYIFELKFIPGYGGILSKHVYQEDPQNKGRAIFKNAEINETYTDLGNPDILNQLLLELISEKNEKYLRKILVTWSHGFGYSMFSSTITKFDIGYTSNEKKGEILNKKKQILVKATEDKYNEISYRIPYRPSILTMKELAFALVGANFDAVIFSNCFMLTTDTLYALQDSVKFLIGTQTTFSWESYSFEHFIVNLKLEDDDIFRDYLYKIADEGFKDTPEKRGKENTVIQEQVSLSVLECNKSILEYNNVDYFFKALHNIVSFFIDHIEEDDDLHEDIKTALSYCVDISEELGNKFIDLYYFLDTFYIKSKYRYTIFDNNYDFINLYKTEIAGYNVNGDKKGQYAGISINFPFDPGAEKPGSYYRIFTDVNSIYQSDFAKETNWGTFLKILENMYA